MAKMFAAPAMGSLRDSVLAIALLLRGKAADALPVASELRNPSRRRLIESAASSLARSLSETGKREAAAKC